MIRVGVWLIYAAWLAAGATPTDADRARARIRATLFVPEPLPLLAAESYGSFEPAPGVTAERVTYATEFGMRVPAIVYSPKVRGGKMPALIVVNGHGGDKYSWYAYYAGILYARAGAVVLTYDPAGEGERNAQRKSGTRQHDRVITPLPEMALRLAGLMQTDLIEAVSYLRSRKDVDSERIAALGHSMGSFVVALGCAVETRLKVCVLTGGGNLDGPGEYWDTGIKQMCQGIPYKSLMFLGDRGAAIYDLHASRGPTLIYNGLADTEVAISPRGKPFFDDLHKRTIALHGSERNVFDYDFDASGGHRPYFVGKPVALWLERQLHFPNWTAESIGQMPETLAATWAERNGASLAPETSRFEGAGGTRALDAGVPAIEHELLNALSVEQWEGQKDRLVYETWVKESLARTQNRP